MAKRTKAWEKSAGKRTFTARIPGVNISISLQPTRKGVVVVRPRVSRVTISRGGGVSENPRKRRRSKRNPLPVITLPGRVGVLGPPMLTRTFRS